MVHSSGLAWTPTGGDILFVEACFIPGTGELVLTGQLGLLVVLLSHDHHVT